MIKTKEEIKLEFFKKFDNESFRGYTLEQCHSIWEFFEKHIQCQEDMIKQEVDVVCPKCKGVNEYIISDKGDYKCAYTDCQHKF
jgi:Zn finger protein HypA/HybF involved in hydrogenase expression